MARARRDGNTPSGRRTPGFASASDSSRAISCSTGTILSVADSVTRPAGPEMEMAAAVGASGTGTARQRTPISCSLSSMAYPCRRTSSSAARKPSGVVMVFSVAAGMPVRPSSACTSSGGTPASSALPTPVECGSTRRPTSVNMRIECFDGTCATYTISSPSSRAMFAVSPVSSTSRARYGRAQVPSSRDADSPRRIRRGPSAYRRLGCWRT